MNTDAIVPRKYFEQMDSLVQQAIPGFSFFVVKHRIAIDFPLLKERGSTIFSSEVSSQGILKAPAEDHGRTSFLFLPAIQIAIPIAARAPQILTDSRVAVDHKCLTARCSAPGTYNRELPSLLPGRTLRGFDTSVRSGSCTRCERLHGDGRGPFHRRGHP